jgi:hypothetical protein
MFQQLSKDVEEENPGTSRCWYDLQRPDIFSSRYVFEQNLVLAL